VSDREANPGAEIADFGIDETILLNGNSLLLPILGAFFGWPIIKSLKSAKGP
jgi:hypothetical protein